ncbi:nucleotidyltransferase family protein [Rodentibacter pneumotropicus]|uniref:Nucleotidyltransferase domain-containing protein n=1 Tax=Rodentibacter pneumotropicus TaxID=758 RepID=A0A4S2PTC6_9PAST|nr:nucleotidyltransferase domain-containing protein [Rodentibacter pneumotropicus]THA06537.1 nucleotidyltransferase domain-containing protein [Rodentibacter pneumotropicus]
MDKVFDIEPKHLAIVQDILRTHLAGYEVRAFGSRVKGTARKFSDLDLVVMSEQPLSLLLFAEVEEAFSESALPYKVDLLDWAAISETFREIISQKYVVVSE